MLHGTTLHRDWTGMNQERIETDLLELQELALARITANGRAPRVCFYAPQQSLTDARSFAVMQGWQAGRCYLDRFFWSTCSARPGWGQVRREVSSGPADGVVVPTLSDVSASCTEYVEQLAWFGEHLAFIAVVEAGRR